MVVASQMRPGMVIRHEAQTWRIIAAEYHPGQGRMGGCTHARLQNLEHERDLDWLAVAAAQKAA